MKYSLEREVKRYNNAGSKAVRDTANLLHKFGFQPLLFESLSDSSFQHSLKSWFVRNIKRFFLITKMFFVLKKGDICFMQWPTYVKSVEVPILRVLKFRQIHLILLIHDLTSLRTGQFAKHEDVYIKFSGTVIAHTSAMKDILIKRGLKENRIKVLTSFDYLLSNDNISQRRLSNEVVFAGNLEKSTFLCKLAKQQLSFSLFCYGKYVDYLKSDSLIYKGAFDADDVSSIEGSWGLVWDGDTIETCNGDFGNYLRINSPHKVSLYIVSRLPIIIWREAALADYVVKKGLGIVIDSINDIPKALSKITESDYNNFLVNIDSERSLLLNGEHLKNSIDV